MGLGAIYRIVQAAITYLLEFKDYHKMLYDLGIKKEKNVLNIDKASACIRCLKGELIIILINIIKYYTSSPKNRKLVIVIKIVIIDSREGPLPFIITLRKKIIDN
ncbi:hypothetical protein LOCC1_G008304 [Lachnellula occidentalis]|uniref:Uncharacterized protein n=1 Tax=Lachnellula occidentalis TaxID=215460 RepID=A0A8H8RDX5_9HELO|nr:hypothetical protein LOCC1_G008304 [Lachnellula occidentalis]